MYVRSIDLYIIYIGYFYPYIPIYSFQIGFVVHLYFGSVGILAWKCGQQLIKDAEYNGYCIFIYLFIKLITLFMISLFVLINYTNQTSGDGAGAQALV